jgi:hypothetical protein
VEVLSSFRDLENVISIGAVPGSVFWLVKPAASDDG